MAKEQIPFEDFMMDVHPKDHAFVQAVNDYLLAHGCQLKIQAAKSGYVASYVHKKSKKTVLNFVFRKAGLFARVYGDHVGTYAELLLDMPVSMKKTVVKASNCKRLLDPADCSSRCSMGYIFELDGEWQRKCRYNAFLFLVDEESEGLLLKMIQSEIDARNAA